MLGSQCALASWYPADGYQCSSVVVATRAGPDLGRGQRIDKIATRAPRGDKDERG